MSNSLVGRYKKYKKIRKNQEHIFGFRKGVTSRIQQNAILFESLHGKSVDGHIFSLIEQVSKRKNLKIYVVTRDIPESKKKFDFYGISTIHFVEHLSFEYGFLLATCKYLVNDNTFYPFFSKRPGQEYYNTWHGTPLKTLGKDMEDITGYSNVQRNFFMTDAILLSNDYTKEIMVNSHNIDKIYNGKVVVGPSPRNSYLFDGNTAAEIRRQNQWENKKIVMYMPTWRGIDGQVVTDHHKLLSDLAHLSTTIDEDTLIIFKGHTMQKSVDISQFQNIVPFPSEYELYHFLSCVDVLITDYSSIMYDFAGLNKKIILYTYDKEEYFSTRGVYEDINDYPFIQVPTIEELAHEINQLSIPGEYTNFIEKFCKYDHLDGAAQITDYIFTGTTNDAVHEYSVRNGKENVFIFCGGLWDNGITAALLNTLDTIDTSKRNYVLIFGKGKMQEQFKFRLKLIPEDVQYYPIPGMSINSIFERVTHKKSTKSNHPDNPIVHKIVKNIYKRETRRIFGDTQVDWYIHYTGFDRKYAELATYMDAKTMMFVHTDMFEDYKNKKNYNQKVVYNAYRNSDKIVLVNDNLRDGFKEHLPEVTEKISVMNNFLGEKRIRELSKENFFSPLIDVRFHHVDSSSYNIDPIAKLKESFQSLDDQGNSDQNYSAYKTKLQMVLGTVIQDADITDELIDKMENDQLLADTLVEDYLEQTYPYRNELIGKLQDHTKLTDREAKRYVDKLLIEDLSAKEANQLFPFVADELEEYTNALEERIEDGSILSQ